MALIFAKTDTDKCLILEAREQLIYPFVAGNWTDLRLGLWISVTNSADNDVITGLTESLTRVNNFDRLFIGFCDNATNGNQTFAGLIGQESANLTEVSVVASSGAGSSSGTTFWRAGGGASGLHARTSIITATAYTEVSASLNGLHMPQDVSAAGGYAVLQIIRLTRATGTSTSIKVNLNGGAINDVGYSSVPTIAAIRALLRSSTFVQSNAIAVNPVPDAIYVYWPYFLSRLRIHALALERFG